MLKDYLSFDMTNQYEITTNPNKIRVHELIRECVKSLLKLEYFDPMDYRLRIRGRFEFLKHEYILGECQYTEACFRNNSTLDLVLEESSKFASIDRQAKEKISFINFVLYPDITNKINKYGDFELFYQSLNKSIDELKKTLETNSNNRIERLRQSQTHVTQFLKAIIISCYKLSPNNDLSNDLSRFGNAINRLIGHIDKIGESKTGDEPDVVDLSAHSYEINEILESISSNLKMFSNAYFRSCQCPFSFIDYSEDKSTLGSPDRISLECDEPFTANFRKIYKLEETQHRDSDNINCIFIRACLMYCGRTLESLSCGQSDTFSNSSSTLTLINSSYCKIISSHKIPSYNPRLNSSVKFASIRKLPRETVLSLALFSAKALGPSEYDWNNAVLLGWVNQPLFDAECKLVRGKHLIKLWPSETTDNPVIRCTYTEPNRRDNAIVLEVDFNVEIDNFSFPNFQPKRTAVMETRDCFDLNDKALDAIKYAENSILLSILNNPDALSEYDKAVTSYNDALDKSNRYYMKIVGLEPLKSNLTVCQSKLAFGDGKSIVCYLLPVLSGPVEILWNLKSYLTTNNFTLSLMLSQLLLFLPKLRDRSVFRVPRSRIKKEEDFSNTQTIRWHSILSEIYDFAQLIKEWDILSSINLLQSTCSDRIIRNFAVQSLSQKSPDQLSLYIPQLVECLNYDLYFDWSGLFQLLIYLSSESINFANDLFWYLIPICSETLDRNFSYRHKILLSTLRHTAGYELNRIWDRQLDSVQIFVKTAYDVKHRKSSYRKVEILKNLPALNLLIKDTSFHQNIPDTEEENIHQHSLVSNQMLSKTMVNVTEKNWNSFGGLYEPGLRLPYNLGINVHMITPEFCSYFSSRTKPLKLVFHSVELPDNPIYLMFKRGDDLELDALVCQLILIMDRIWLNENIDLRLKHYKVLPTGNKQGFIELVPGCNTLRQIQISPQGSIKSSTSIYNWLIKKNQDNHSKVMENFMRSLVASCIITYILGLGDRHNDNVMICNTGQIFQIDFSKCFGQAQEILGIKRDRSPFLLLPDFVYILENYTNPDYVISETTKFDLRTMSSLSKGGIPMFVDLCCEAFVALRKNMNLILILVESALKVNIPELPNDASARIYSLFRTDLCDRNLRKEFVNLIKISYESKSPIVNNLIHIFVQFGSNGTHGTNPDQTESGKTQSDVSNSNSDSEELSGCEENQTLLTRSQSADNLRKSICSSNRTSIVSQVQTVKVDKLFSHFDIDGKPVLYYPIQIYYEQQTPETIYREPREMIELIEKLRNPINDKRFDNECNFVRGKIFSQRLAKDISQNVISIFNKSQFLMAIDKWFDYLLQYTKENYGLLAYLNDFFQINENDVKVSNQSNQVNLSRPMNPLLMSTFLPIKEKLQIQLEINFTNHPRCIDINTKLVIIELNSLQGVLPNPYLRLYLKRNPNDLLMSDESCVLCSTKKPYFNHLTSFQLNEDKFDNLAHFFVDIQLNNKLISNNEDIKELRNPSSIQLGSLKLPIDNFKLYRCQTEWFTLNQVSPSMRNSF